MSILGVIAALVFSAAFYTIFVYLMFKDIKRLVPSDKDKKE